MGGGNSAMREMDEVITCTYLLGRAIAAMSFPDVYRLQDFHSGDAPSLRGSEVPPALMRVIGEPPRPDGKQENRPSAEDFDYDSRFVVVVGTDRIVLDRVGEPNENGWTPLHSCCHSHTTISAGFKIVAEMEKLGCSFDRRTLKGPGAHNAGWTALHMACAYGVEPLVTRLVQAGANVNVHNSMGWSPLHEACHRGFAGIVHELVRAGADLGYVPDEDTTRRFPFARPPPQSPLGEAARCGFKEIVKFLLEKGCAKNQLNAVGWSPLHEAAFYNHLPVVQMLLVYGADAGARNKQGLVAFQLATPGPVREVISELGGPDAVPEGEARPFVFRAGQEQEDEAELDLDRTGGDSVEAPLPSPRDQPSPVLERTEQELLHSGALLGDLPSLTAHRSPTHDKRGRDGSGGGAGASKASSRDGRGPRSGGGSGSDSGRPGGADDVRDPHTRRTLDPDFDTADDRASFDPRDDGGLPPKQRALPIPPGFPREYLCQISKRPMTDPVRTPYGNVFDRGAALMWISRNGSVCPITGTPLSESELQPDMEMKHRITQWHVKRAMQKQSEAAGGDVEDGAAARVERQSPASSPSAATGGAVGSEQRRKVAAEEEDMYDF